MAIYRVTFPATGTGSVVISLDGVTAATVTGPTASADVEIPSGVHALRLTASGSMVVIGDVTVANVSHAVSHSDSAGTSETQDVALGVPVGDERSIADASGTTDAAVVLEGWPREVTVPFNLSISLDALLVLTGYTDLNDAARTGDVVAIGVARPGGATDAAGTSDAVTVRVFLLEQEGPVTDTAAAGDEVAGRRNGVGEFNLPGPKPFRYWRDGDLNRLREAIQAILDYLNN